MSSPMSLRARFNRGEWELCRAADAWRLDPHRFNDLRTLFVQGPRLVAEDEGMSEEDSLHVRAVIEFDDQHTCPIGKRGRQALCDVTQDLAPAWHEPLVEYAMTIGHTGGSHVAIHQVTYGDDGHHRFDGVRLPLEVAMWAAEHLGGLAEVGMRAQSRPAAF